MFARTIAPELIKMSNLYPVVTSTGPRQSGKTTLGVARLLATGKGW